MIREVQYQQQNCPIDIRAQIMDLLQTEWPNTFKNNQEDWPTESAELNPISILLMDDGQVISHAVVLRKSIKHCEEYYLAFGLGSVVTKRSYRHKGYGHRIVQSATQYIREQNADIGVFTCDPQLQNFYANAGWQVSMNSPLVGGTIEKPFRSDKLGKITLIQLFSDRVKASRSKIASAPIIIELGEGKLW
jgi:GNAT superfamily N-acetyltransferase